MNTMARDHLLCTKTGGAFGFQDEANAEVVAKTCILWFNQQGTQRMVEERPKMSDCQYGKEHKIQTFTNLFKIFGE